LKFGLWIVGGTLLTIVAVSIVLSVLVSRNARYWMQDWLSREYKSQVELSGFTVAIPFPLVQAEAVGVTLHFRGRRDLPPLIAINRLTMRTSMLGLIHNPRRISFVRLEGLQINIPPREESRGSGDSVFGQDAMRKFHMVRFSEIDSDGATLKILTSKPGKNPLEFDLQKLSLHSSGPDDALAFHVTLSNPVPPGKIISSGIFGPWNADVPSQTAVSGDYTFEHADLGFFPGISGILSSKGNYQGELDKIRADGTTDTPDFKVAIAGHPVHLSTIFHAMVDGTDGNVYLQPVESHFGETVLVANGSVEGKAGTKGKTITLDVTTSNGRIQDLLLLALKDSPPMTGPINLKTKFILVPGPKQIPDRLHLDGFFDLSSLHFTSSLLQQKVDNMSKRSEGKPNEVVNPVEAIKTDDVASRMKGNFRLENGILSMNGLNYSLPGADVQLAGTYGLEPESLDFYGKLILQAKLSQTTTGFTSFLLKFADPIFSKGHKGTVLPIKITGSVQNPHYGLELGHKSIAAKENK
jgi:hypothetical protein